MNWMHIGRMAGIVVLVLAPLGAEGSGQGPVIRFAKTVHDFGEIASDTRVDYSWPYENVGDEPLLITGTRPQCGCTATVVDEQAVPPGGTGILRITFDPAGLSGSIRKSLAVRTNEHSGRRTLLEIQATVTAVEVTVAAGEHPPIAGQSLLLGDCAGCHAEPAAGLAGEALYGAVCAMCHGDRAGGGLAPSLRDPDYLESRSDEDLHGYITYGSANPKMPGFSQMMGGPLSGNQVDSLVELLRAWGPLSSGGR